MKIQLQLIASTAAVLFSAFSFSGSVSATVSLSFIVHSLRCACCFLVVVMIWYDYDAHNNIHSHISPCYSPLIVIFYTYANAHTLTPYVHFLSPYSQHCVHQGSYHHLQLGILPRSWRLWHGLWRLRYRYRLCRWCGFLRFWCWGWSWFRGWRRRAPWLLLVQTLLENKVWLQKMQAPEGVRICSPSSSYCNWDWVNQLAHFVCVCLHLHLTKRVSMICWQRYCSWWLIIKYEWNINLDKIL